MSPRLPLRTGRKAPHQTIYDADDVMVAVGITAEHAAWIVAQTNAAAAVPSETTGGEALQEEQPATPQKMFSELREEMHARAVMTARTWLFQPYDKVPDTIATLMLNNLWPLVLKELQALADQVTSPETEDLKAYDRAETHAQLIARAVKMILAGLDLSTEQQQLVPQIVPPILRAIASDPCEEPAHSDLQGAPTAGSNSLQEQLTETLRCNTYPYGTEQVRGDAPEIARLMAAVTGPHLDVLEQQIKAARADAKDHDEAATRWRRRAEEAEAERDALREGRRRIGEHQAALRRALGLSADSLWGDIIEAAGLERERADEAERERDDYAARLRATDKACSERAADLDHARAELRKADSENNAAGKRAQRAEAHAAVYRQEVAHHLAAANRVRALAMQAREGAAKGFSRTVAGAPFPALLRADAVLAALRWRIEKPNLLVVDREDLTAALTPLAAYIDRTAGTGAAEQLAGVLARLRALLEPPANTTCEER